jgi:hypothetical protein
MWVIEEMEMATQHLNAAMAECASLERMPPVDSRLMGHARACHAVNHH